MLCSEITLFKRWVKSQPGSDRGAILEGSSYAPALRPRISHSSQVIHYLLYGKAANGQGS